MRGAVPKLAKCLAGQLPGPPLKLGDPALTAAAIAGCRRLAGQLPGPPLKHARAGRFDACRWLIVVWPGNCPAPPLKHGNGRSLVVLVASFGRAIARPSIEAAHAVSIAAC